MLIKKPNTGESSDDLTRRKKYPKESVIFPQGPDAVATFVLLVLTECTCYNARRTALY